MYSPMTQFGGLSGMAKRLVSLVQSGMSDLNVPVGNSTPMSGDDPEPFTNPVIEQSPLDLRHPMSGFNLGPMDHPIQEQSLGPISRMGNPDYTGQHGFPEKPTGIGGLRPIGSLMGSPEEGPTDPGEISIFEQFGNKGLATLGHAIPDSVLNPVPPPLLENPNVVKPLYEWIQRETQLSNDQDIEGFIENFGGSFSDEGLRNMLNKMYPGGYMGFMNDIERGELQ